MSKNKALVTKAYLGEWTLWYINNENYGGRKCDAEEVMTHLEGQEYEMTKGDFRITVNSISEIEKRLGHDLDWTTLGGMIEALHIESEIYEEEKRKEIAMIEQYITHNQKSTQDTLSFYKERLGIVRNPKK